MLSGRLLASLATSTLSADGGPTSALGRASGARLPDASDALGASVAARSGSGLLDWAGRPCLWPLPVVFVLVFALALAVAVGPELLAVGAGARRKPRHLAALAKMWKGD